MKASTVAIVSDLFDRYHHLLCCEKSINQALQLCVNCYEQGGKLLVCGNGGSAADSQHIVGELMKSFVLPRKLSAEMKCTLENKYPESAAYLYANLQQALPAISLIGEAALTTAYANDMAPDLGFAQQVYGLGCKGDVLLAISTSGNSRNVVYAAQIAHALDMKVIGLLGGTGGKMNELCTVSIVAPCLVTYRIQECHLPIYHTLCLALENEFFYEGKDG